MGGGLTLGRLGRSCCGEDMRATDGVNDEGGGKAKLKGVVAGVLHPLDVLVANGAVGLEPVTDIHQSLDLLGIIRAVGRWPRRRRAWLVPGGPRR